jgi:hypothetical protein
MKPKGRRRKRLGKPKKEAEGDEGEETRRKRKIE